MNKNYINKFMSIFALGAALITPSLKASEPNDHIFDESISKKRPLERESDTSTPLSKRLRLKNSPESLENDDTSTQFSFFESMPPELLWHITSFLPKKDKHCFAFWDKKHHKTARNDLINRDIRYLKDRIWINGPQKNTFENYLFNHVIWETTHNLIQSRLENNPTHIPNITVLLEGYSYLKDRFSNLKALKGILEGISNPQVFLESTSFKEMSEHALQNPTGGEADFLSLIEYMNGQDFKLPDKISTPMGFLERFLRVKRAYQMLASSQTTLESNAFHRDFLLAYDLKPVTVNDIIHTANTYMDAGISSSNPDKKRAALLRAVDLYNRAIAEQAPQDSIYELYKKTAMAHHHLGTLSTNPDEKCAAFMHSAKIFEIAIHALDPKIPNVLLYKTAMGAHCNFALHTNNPDEKRAAFLSAAKIFSMYPQLHSHDMTLFLKKLAQNLQEVREEDTAQTIRARIIELTPPEKSS